MHEAFKKKMLSSHEYFQAKRWEGKPWNFKLKYLIANYPEIAFTSFGFLFIVPATLFLKYLLLNHEKYDAMRKYKPTYTVVREDDPNIAKIRYLKELGRQHFPK